MKSIKFLSVLALIFTMALFQSCEDDPCEGVTCLNDGICLDGTCDCSTGYSGVDCGTHCSEDIIGTWNVTNVTGICDYTSYVFSKGSTDTAIDVIAVAIDGTNVPGTGTLSFDCATMTYSLPSVSITGSIIFNGNMLTDDVLNGTCTIEATKQ